MKCNVKSRCEVKLIHEQAKNTLGYLILKRKQAKSLLLHLKNRVIKIYDNGF